MDDSSIYRITFTTSLGQWEFLVIPFGLCNAPAIFQRLMNQVFATEINQFILVYLDDILIFMRIGGRTLGTSSRGTQKTKGGTTIRGVYINVNSSKLVWTTSVMRSARKEFLHPLKKVKAVVN